MKSLHSGEGDVSRFLKITPQLLYCKGVSRSGRTGCLEANWWGLEQLFAPNPVAQVRGSHWIFVVCHLICEVKVVMRIHLTGQLQGASQSALSLLATLFCHLQGEEGKFLPCLLPRLLGARGTHLIVAPVQRLNAKRAGSVSPPVIGSCLAPTSTQKSC